MIKLKDHNYLLSLGFILILVLGVIMCMVVSYGIYRNACETNEILNFCKSMGYEDFDGVASNYYVGYSDVRCIKTVNGFIEYSAYINLDNLNKANFSLNIFTNFKNTDLIMSKGKTR